MRILYVRFDKMKICNGSSTGILVRLACATLFMLSLSTFADVSIVDRLGSLDRRLRITSVHKIGYKDCTNGVEALDMEYLGEVSAEINRKNPRVSAYANLYQNYAQVSWNTSSQQTSQLGTRTYGEYIDAYCRTMPVDFICYDHYPFGGDENNIRFNCGPRMYANLQTVADACRRTGRSFWMIPQVNSKPKHLERLTEGNFRFQASVAMAYGCEAILWATWNHAFWTNSVLTVSGERSDHYEKIKKVNWEVHRLGPEYMRFRNVGTSLCDFPADEVKALSRWGVKTVSGFRSAMFDSLRAEDASAFAVGEMVSRTDGDGTCAALVVPVGDMFDSRRATRRICFKTSCKVSVFGLDGPIACKASSDGRYSFGLKDGYAALVVMEPPGNVKGQTHKRGDF